MKTIKGGITAAKGFKANGVSCGIKRSGKLDLSLIVSDKPAVSAGVFTKSSIIAAPLVVSKKHMRSNKTKAIIINSGNANCFTGNFGLIYAQRTTELIGKLLHVKKEYVIVSSTGIIGKPLPYKKIQAAAKGLVSGLNKAGAKKAARGILTTDTKIKEVSVQFTLSGKKITIGGCAKGSGMVAPNMATMLAFVTTDANINAKMLKSALRSATQQSFNRITIDGCMSTNDMATILANGSAGNPVITAKSKGFNAFCDALNFVCLNLAKKMVLDGEGATKFIEIEVKGAKTERQAHQASVTIANSVLVKTAAFGNNPNWGRVAAAVGSLGIKSITETELKIKFSSFQEKYIKIDVDLNIGKQSATVFTSDLSHEYVRINGEYN